MAYPSKIKIGITDSIKVDDYQYAKPYMEVEISLNVGDNFTESVDKGKKYLMKELSKFREDIIKEKRNG